MSDMFGGDDFQDEMDFMITSILESTLDDYGLKNEPVDGTLEACLNAYTKVKLLKIAEENGLTVQQGWKKAKLVETLSAGILDSLDERFLILQKRGLTLLQFMAEGKLSSDNYTRENTEFLLTVYRIAVRFGLLYTTEVIGGVVMIMPGEIKMRLDEALENFEELQVEYASKLKLWDDMNEVLVAGVNLYGIMTVAEIHKLWQIRHGKFTADTLDEMMVFYNNVRKYLPLLIIDKGYLFVDKILIASSNFDDAEDALDFYYHQSENIGNVYYEPSKQEIQFYAEHSFNRDTLIYKRLTQEVKKMTDDVELFMNLVENTILIDEDVSELIMDTVEVGLIDFETEEQFERFMDLYIDLEDASRVWMNGGFTANEMGRHITEGAYFFDDEIEDEEIDSGNIISLDAFRRMREEE